LAWRIVLETANGDRFSAGPEAGLEWSLNPIANSELGVCYTLALDGAAGARRPTGRVVGLCIEVLPAVSGVFELEEALVLRPQPARRRNPNRRLLGGRVCLASGAPAAGCGIELKFAAGIQRTRTDADGRYLFRNLPDDLSADLSVPGRADSAFFMRGNKVVLPADRLDYDICLLEVAAAAACPGRRPTFTAAISG
jgi:hypothetical protein